MSSRFLLAAALLVAATLTTPAADPPLRLPVTRDLWVSAVGDEANGNNGGAPRLKLKSIQEMSLLDFDPAPLAGRVVRRAALHLRTASPQEVLKRVTVSTVAAEWVEGMSSGYKPEIGASTFNHCRHPNGPWSYAGSTLPSVTLGQGGTIWRMADATPPDAEGWQVIPVDPLVVMARTAGVSTGLLAFDDTGSEWTRAGERFTQHPFPNRFVNSRESNRSSAPFLTVELGDEDKTPPDAPTEAARPADRRPPVGDGIDVLWTTPADRGAGVVGFRVEIDGKPVPRHLIPAPTAAGVPAWMRLRPGDVPLSPPGFTVTVRAVDGAGNVGPPLELRRPFAGWAKPYEWATPAVPMPAVAGKGAKLGGADVFVLDPLDKVHPVTGETIPPQPAAYQSANHLWGNGTVTLHAARNEFVGCQVVIRGAVAGVTAELDFGPDAGDVATSFYRYAYVPSTKGPLPDPLVPLRGPFAVPTPSERIAGQTSGSLLAEVYVGHATPPGKRAGRLRLKAGGDVLELPVELTVWPFALPDRLSFLPEMNCYGLPANETAYYRLAHWHRTVLNRVPYNQRGEVAEGCAPRVAGGRFDWTAWDARFGPLLDGRAFADLPRKGVPLEAFYLPQHENWPAPMAGNYNGGYWADAAFPPAYRKAFADAAREFAAHFSERGYGDTLFQGFLNNKVDFKRNGWSRGSSPWLLDEPANWQDFWALRWFGEAFHEGARAAGPGKARMTYRADISRPEWQRDGLDAVLDYNVVAASAFGPYHRLVTDRRDRLGQIVLVYGGSNAVEASNVQPAAWCLDAWSLGADGVVPWQTVGTNTAWTKADDTALFYPGQPAGLRSPVPSVRLKAYLRGQQDVEYLALLEASSGATRRAVGEAIRAMLKLAPVWQGSGRGGDDAGVVQYGDLKPHELWAVRTRVAAELAGRKVVAATPLTAVPIPRRPPEVSSPGYVAEGR